MDKNVPSLIQSKGSIYRASDLVSPKTCATLTGIEPAGYQFSSVQLGLSSCVFGLVQFATRAFRAVWMTDVLPRCCPATRIRLLKIPDSLRPLIAHSLSRSKPDSMRVRTNARPGGLPRKNF